MLELSGWPIVGNVHRTKDFEHTRFEHFLAGIVAIQPNFREFCEKIFEANTFCENDHYICDSCHQSGAIEIIENVTETTEIKDPFVLADKIMHHPKFKMYGPEHHVLTPAVILTTSEA